MKGRTRTSSRAPEKSPSPEKNGGQGKAKWIEKAKAAGIKDAERLSVREIRAELKRLKDAGLLEDGRKGNGGAREGSGQVALSKDPRIVDIKTEHLFEEVEVVITDRQGGTRSEKKSTMRAMLDMLRGEALKNKSVAAAKEYFDRTLGRAKQEIEHSGEIKAEEQKLPSRAQMAAATAYEDALDEEDDDDEV